MRSISGRSQQRLFRREILHLMWEFVTAGSHKLRSRAEEIIKREEKRKSLCRDHMEECRAERKSRIREKYLSA